MKKTRKIDCARSYFTSLSSKLSVGSFPLLRLLVLMRSFGDRMMFRNSNSRLLGPVDNWHNRTKYSGISVAAYSGS